MSFTCLECWLLADPAAVEEFASGPRGGRAAALPKRQTDRHSPLQAKREIEEIIRRTKGRGGKHCRYVGYQKSDSVDIAKRVEPGRAAGNNASLDYFWQQVGGERDGCGDNRQQVEL